MKVKKLFIHCLKSAKGQELKSLKVLKSGFLNDRNVAVVDVDNKIITGREFPKLLSVASAIINNHLELREGSSISQFFKLPDSKEEAIEIKLFRNITKGVPFGIEASRYISKLLRGEFRLVYLGGNFRVVSPKRGGRDGEITGYADSAPVHLISLSTMKYLNSKLSNKVSARNFRTSWNTIFTVDTRRFSSFIFQFATAAIHVYCHFNVL